MVQVDGPGDGSKWRLNISAATVAATCSALGVVIFLGGFVTGYMSYTRSMSDLAAQNASVNLRLDRMATDIGVLNVTVAEIRSEMKAISQNVGQLQLQNVPKR